MTASDRPVSSGSANSLFACLRVLCDHHGVELALTPESLDALVAEHESLAAAEAALVETGFEVSRMQFSEATLRQPGQPFPFLTERRRGGYVLVVGVSPSNGDYLVGVYDPEAGRDRARRWTSDLVTKGLTGEALQAALGDSARPSRRLVATPTTHNGPAASARRILETGVRKRRDLMADIYADAFENILVHGGTVRIDLASFAPREQGEPDDQPRLELTGRLVMPIEGFVRAFGGIGEVVRQMVEAGVIEPVEGGAPGGRA